jgi:NAD(P)H-hydrate epimerase
MKDCGLPILSVDIPSGWHVEDGPQVSPLTTFTEYAHQQPLYTQGDDQGKSENIETFIPEALISLTVPKLGVRQFKGQHWLGGRFVPESVISSRIRMCMADVIVSSRKSSS